MVAIPISPDKKRKWYGLALRHLRMASRLVDSSFIDGAVFHIYHAYECTVSSLIAAKGFAVPPDGKVLLTLSSGKQKKGYASPRGGITENSTHKARLILFNQLADPTKGYTRIHRSLGRFMVLGDRMDALYYDVKKDLLPHERYDRAFAVGAYSLVRQFAREVWKDIR
jgi:hypothetical protein